MQNKHGKRIKLKMIDFSLSFGIYLILILKILFRQNKEMTRREISDEIEKITGNNPYDDRTGELHHVFDWLHEADLIIREEKDGVLVHSIKPSGLTFLRTLKVIPRCENCRKIMCECNPTR